MISVSYVNGNHDALLLSDPALKFESVIDSLLEESESMYNAFIDNYNQYLFESEILEEEDRTITYGDTITESENIFEKIGQQILKAIEAFKKFITDIVAKMKGFDKKSDFDKLNEATKSKDPEVKKAMIDAFNRGDLSVYDAKSIKDIEDAYLELLKNYKDEGIDPNTFKGKCQLFRKKIENADKTALVNGARAITVVTGGILAIPMIKKSLNDIKASSLDLSSKQTREMEDFARIYDAMKKSDDPNVRNAVDPANGKTVMMHNMLMLKTGLVEKCINKNDLTYNKIMEGIKKVTSLVDKSGKLTSKIDKIADAKHSKEVDAANKYASMYDSISKSKNPSSPDPREVAKQQTLGRHDAETTIRDTKRNWSKQDAIDKAEAQLKFTNSHQDEILDNEYRKSYAQAQGKTAENEAKWSGNNRRTTSKIARDEAYNKAQGTNAAKPRRKKK